MNSPYQIKSFIQPSFFQRLFKIEPKENALIEVNNLLESKPSADIKVQDINDISEKYKVDLRNNFLVELKELYRNSLMYCLTDNLLDNQDVVLLNHLKDLLLLSKSEVEEIKNIEAGIIYDKFYQEAISDGEITTAEEEYLTKLKENLKLPTIIEEEISDQRRTEFIQNEFNKITSDMRISPEEWKDFETVAKNLNVTINPDHSVDKLKLYWQIENGQMPIKDVSINLQKGESCYFSSYAEWLENRTITKRINYGGPTARIRIMKGVYYRAGSVGVQRVTSNELQTIDEGQVFITNKRVIFLGSKKNTSIQLSKILSLNPYSDAVGIEKDSGKSPIIKVDDNADLLAMTLSRVINDSKF